MDLVVEAGEIEILVGSSAEDIKLQDKIEITEDRILNEYYREYYSQYQGE